MLTVLAQGANGGRDLLVVGDTGSGVTHRAKVLGRVEAECPEVADIPSSAVVADRSMCLTRVLDEYQRVTSCDGLERCHIGHRP